MNDKQNNNNDKDITSAIDVEHSLCDGDSESNVVTNENGEETPAVEKPNEKLEKSTGAANISSGPNDFSDIPNKESLKPGSWVVLTKDSIDEPGKKVIQHYIVGPNYDANDLNKKDNFIPITLPPDVMKTVTNCIQNIEPENTSKM